MWTQIWLLLLEEQSDLGPHCLPVCKNRFEKFSRIFSRRHKQTTFSDAGFLGVLRVNHLQISHIHCFLYKVGLCQEKKNVFEHWFGSQASAWPSGTPNLRRSQDPRFKSHLRQNSADVCTVLQCSEPFIITPSSSGYNLTLVLLNPNMPCLYQQCRSRSVGFRILPLSI